MFFADTFRENGNFAALVAKATAPKANRSQHICTTKPKPLLTNGIRPWWRAELAPPRGGGGRHALRATVMTDHANRITHARNKKKLFDADDAAW